MLPPDGLTPEEVAIGHIGMLSIYRDQLNDWERIVIAMRYEMLWSIPDISYATGRTNESVREVIEKIKKRLEARFTV